MKTLVTNSVINNSEISIIKKSLRKAVLNKRDGISRDEHKKYSEIITERFISWDVYKECEELLVYVSFRSEVDTYGIISDALTENKKVYCPRVIGDNMLFYQIKSMEDLEQGYMGILEPETTLPLFECTDKKCLVIMPGSVFDRYGNRIGYGRGYYDRFLSDCYDKGIRSVKAALAFDIQMVYAVPAEEHDFKVNFIFTEKETIMI